MQRTDTYKAGLMAELVASIWIMLKGYRILSRRFKTPVGEIDLIAKRGKTIVFIEVKKRADVGDALAAISPENASRVRRAAQWWLKGNARIADKCDIRFDAVALANYARPQHIPNAF